MLDNAISNLFTCCYMGFLTHQTSSIFSTKHLYIAVWSKISNWKNRWWLMFRTRFKISFMVIRAKPRSMSRLVQCTWSVNCSWTGQDYWLFWYPAIQLRVLKFRTKVYSFNCWRYLYTLYHIGKKSRNRVEFVLRLADEGKWVLVKENGEQMDR